MNKYLANNKVFKERRRALRRKQTPAEKIMWSYVRNRKLDGLRFLRQYSLGPYILDFFCPEHKFAIELDGSVHTSIEAIKYDKDRESYLSALGIKTVRFKNDEMISNPTKVINSLLPLLFIREVETKSG